MGVALGWQQMANAVPEIWGNPWNDGISRNNSNVISYNMNLSMRVGTQYGNGFWDYLWYVDLDMNGQNVSNGRLVKASTAWRQILRGREFYMSTHSGNYYGQVGVDKNASSIRFRATFHDSNGNWGWATYWNVGIPRAGEPGAMSTSTSDLTSSQITIAGSTTGTGAYSLITQWKLEYGIGNYTGGVTTSDGNVLSKSWNLSNLTPDTNYQYRLTVTNSSGFARSLTGTFKTLEDNIGYIIIRGDDGEDIVKEIKARVILPDNTVRRVRRVKRVDQL